jgi:hypothetical protein
VNKILSMEVKPSVPRRRFTASKRSLNGVEKASFRQSYRTPFSPTVPPFDTRSARASLNVAGASEFLSVLATSDGRLA